MDGGKLALVLDGNIYGAALKVSLRFAGAIFSLVRKPGQSATLPGNILRLMRHVPKLDESQWLKSTTPLFPGVEFR
jgi:hypothetical protein